MIIAAKFLRLRGVTRTDRHEAIHQIREALARSGAGIDGFQMFSNLSACFRFEIAPEDVAGLRSRLLTTAATLSAESLEQLDAVCEAPVPGSGDLRGTLEITFLHDEPDLKRDVPAFDL